MDDLTLKLEALLWNPRVNTLHPALNRSVRAIRFLYAILRDVLTTTLTLRAMGLVYITIMSIVPMLALAFSALKGFGIHRSRIEPMLRNVLDPLGDKGAQLTAQLIGFVDNVQGGLLAGAGLVLLIYTTVSMIKKVEDSLNHIWRVDSSRNFLQRFGEYLSIVLVGPLLMLTALGLIASASSNTIVERILEIEPLGSTAVLVGRLSPFIILAVTFALAYWFIPNTRVKARAAIVGGLTGGILWTVSGKLFAAFVASSTRNADIYASFAVIIIALIWLYISWLILLIGAQASFYFQNPEYTRVGYRNLRVGNELVEQMALSLMLLVAERFRSTDDAMTTNEAAERIGVPGLLLAQVRERLSSAGLLHIDNRDQLLPARDPAGISLSTVLEAVRGAHESDVYRGGRWPSAVSHLFLDLHNAQRTVLGEQSLYELLDNNADRS
ncbi:MAG: YihY family inner membrane protein [Gammaproteobacteria bacterium]|nr:YihY family inner membrane protein [Gammaproteobacteria bacterium]